MFKRIYVVLRSEMRWYSMCLYLHISITAEAHFTIMCHIQIYTLYVYSSVGLMENHKTLRLTADHRRN